MEMLAGQALKPWTPRGLGKLLGGEILFGHGGLGYLGLMSPRLLGEASYYGGVASRPVERVGRAVFDRVGSRAAGQAAYRLGALQDDARERLKDKSKPLSADDKKTLRSVAYGEASVDERMKADALLKRLGSGGGRNVPQITVHPRPQYGGVQ
jgi:hypothetical protein